MNPSQSPSLSTPRDRYHILDDLTAAFRRACERHDLPEITRLHTLCLRVSYQIRFTRLANRYASA